MRRIKLLLEYNGTPYHGWQVQENARTIQEEVEQAIGKISGEKVRVTGAGRTDAGVHAYGQGAHFDTNSIIPADKFKDALNAMLPRDIAVICSEEVTPDFHARFSAVRKTYEYCVMNRRARSPLMENRAWHVREPINDKLMQQAAQYFVGNHDFTSFCSSGHGVSTYIRTIFTSEWRKDGDCIIYRVQGSGFLYNMVRIMTGTMIEVGLGKRRPECIPTILSGKDRNEAGITAPAQGLYLLKVHYGEE